MPFVEIHPRENDWIRVTVAIDGEISITIAKNIRDKYFVGGTITPLNFCQRVGVFIDKENGLLGLKPQSDGYKMDDNGRIWVSKLRDYNIHPETYEAKWDEKNEMIISRIVLHGSCDDEVKL